MDDNDKKPHISVSLMYDYWFSYPLHEGEQEFIKKHLDECAYCRDQLEKYRTFFPDRRDPVGV